MKTPSWIFCCAMGILTVPATRPVVAQAIGKPRYGAWGFDRSAMDLKVKPGDDFNRYANGSWMARTDIPADKSIVTLRSEMSDLIESRLHKLMQDAASSALRSRFP